MWEKVKSMMSCKKGFEVVYNMHAFSLVNFLVWFSSVDRDTTKPYPHSSVEDAGEEAKKSIVKEDRGKKKKKRRAEDKRHPRKRMSDSDELKQRERSSLPSNEEEFEGKEVALKNYED